jgi:cobalt transporter subunit CbtB
MIDTKTELSYAGVPRSQATVAWSDLGAAAAVFFVGVGLFLTVGFANISAVHNAAHDARHSVGLVCH